MNLLLATSEAAEQLQSEPTVVTEIMSVDHGRATIKVIGPISRYGSFFTSTESINAAITIAMDMDIVTELFFEVDSNGGDARGIFDLSSRIRNLKGKKTTAYVTANCASAALVIATACKTLYVSPSATLGSVGVVMSVMNKSGMEDIITRYVSDAAPQKVGAPGDPLFDSNIQERVNFLHGIFIKELQANLSNTNTDYGDGKMFNSNEAVTLFNAKIQTGYPKIMTTETKDDTTPSIEDMKKDLITRERKRVADIKSVAIEGHSELIEQCIADGESVEATMRMILVAEKKTKTAAVESLAKDEPAPILSTEPTATDTDDFMSPEIKKAYQQYSEAGLVNIKGVK